MILKTVYHMNLLDFRNFLLKNVLRNLFSHRVKSLKNNSCLSSHGFGPNRQLLRLASISKLLGEGFFKKF